MQHALQDIADSIAGHIALPVSLTDPDLNSLVFGPHDERAIDQVRRQSLLTRSETFDLADLGAIGQDVSEIGRLLHERGE
jgi:hypothetical protein